MGYSMDQILTIASLIQREGSNPDEVANIAAVIYNRLNAGMQLEMDATITYIESDVIPYFSGDIDPSGPYITPISVRPCPPALSAIRGFPPLRPPYIRRMCLIFTSATMPAVTIITPLPTRSTSKTCKRPGSAERDPESVRGPSHSAAFPAGRTLVSPSHAPKKGDALSMAIRNGARPIIRPTAFPA